MHKSEDWPIVYTLFAMSAAQGWRCAAGGRVIFWSELGHSFLFSERRASDGGF